MEGKENNKFCKNCENFYEHVEPLPVEKLGRFNSYPSCWLSQETYIETPADCPILSEIDLLCQTCDFISDCHFQGRRPVVNEVEMTECRTQAVDDTIISSSIFK